MATLHPAGRLPVTTTDKLDVPVDSSVANPVSADVDNSLAPGSQRELLVTVACRNLSSNSSVVALFEAKDALPGAEASDSGVARLLEYVAHTEGIRHSHHPDFQTPLAITHTQGKGQKVKFNVYTLPPGNTRVEEHQRLGSAYVLLDEIAAHLGEDLLVELVHGHNAEKDKNNMWLKSHMLINATIKPPAGHEDASRSAITEVKNQAVSTATAGRVLTLHSDADPTAPPARFLFFYRPDDELGALHWLELNKCDRTESKEPEAVPEEGTGRTVKYTVPNSYDAKKAVADDSLQVVRLIDILAIYEGQQTSSFRPSSTSGGKLPPADHCFSIILEDGSVDIECRDTTERESFMLCIHTILTQQAARERARANQYRFLVKVRNLPPTFQREGGLFVAASSRASKGLDYEVVGKTGWLAATITPDFPRALHAAFVSDTQMLKFDLFHNSLRQQDGVGTAIVDFSALRAQVGRMVIIPLRNLVDPVRDRALQESKAVMLLECMEAQPHEMEEIKAKAATKEVGGIAAAAGRQLAINTGANANIAEGDEDEDIEDEDDDEAASSSSSDDENDGEYLGAKLAKLRDEHADVLNAAQAGSPRNATGGRLIDGESLMPSLTSLPPVPAPPNPPRVSIGLFNGYLLDKYAFSSKTCSRKVVFAARDMDIDAEEAKSGAGSSAAAAKERSVSPPPSLTVNTLSSPGPQGTGKTPHGAIVTTFGASPHAQAVQIAGADQPGQERNPERMRLYWTKPEKGAGKTERREQSSSVKLAEITNIQVGKTTATLQRKDAAAVTEETALSIVWGERTLDLVADTSDVRDALVADLINFLLPRSKTFSAYGQAGTGNETREWLAYEKQCREHQQAVKNIEAQIAARIDRAAQAAAAQAVAAAAVAAGSGSAAGVQPVGGDGAVGPNVFDTLAGDADDVPMPDLQAAMAILSKLHERGMKKLGINPEGISAGKKEQPDILSSLAALEDIFAELDKKFASTPTKSIQAAAAAAAASGVVPGVAGTGEATGDGSARGAARGFRKRDGTTGDEGGLLSDDEDKDESAARGSGRDELTPEERQKRLEEAERLAGLKSPQAGDEDDEADEKTMAEIEARLAAATAAAVPANKEKELELGPDGVPLPPPAPDMSGFVVGDAPPPPPGPPPIGAAGPVPQVRRLKQLHWDPLAQEEVISTIFFNLQSQATFAPSPEAIEAGDSAALDAENLDFLFANKQAKDLKSLLVNKSNAAKGLSIIESKRAYNIEIGISRLKTTLPELRQQLLTMDPLVLTEEKAQILFDRIPTLEEMAQLRLAKVPVDQLGVVEQFLLMMSSIPQVGLRLECHLFILRFPEQAVELKQRLRTLFAACKSLSGSTHLRAVLEVVLQVGNHLNEGTRKGNAAGFKLASLPALSNTRSVDGRMTLLDFVAQHVDRTLKTPVERAQRMPFLSADMAPLKDAVNLDWAAVVDEQRRMAMQIKKIEAIIAVPAVGASGGEDRFHERLQAFYPYGAEESRLLSSRLKRVVQLESSLLAYFGENISKMSLTAMFSIFSTFTQAFEQAEGKIKSNRPVKAKRGSRSQAAGVSTGVAGAAGIGGGVVDPRLGGSFSTELQQQGGKLRHQRRKSMYLTGGYAGRKTDTGRTIAPAACAPALGETVVRAKRISISLGRGGIVGPNGPKSPISRVRSPKSPLSPLSQTAVPEETDVEIATAAGNAGAAAAAAST